MPNGLNYTIDRDGNVIASRKDEFPAPDPHALDEPCGTHPVPAQFPPDEDAQLGAIGRSVQEATLTPSERLDALESKTFGTVARRPDVRGDGYSFPPPAQAELTLSESLAALASLRRQRGRPEITGSQSWQDQLKALADSTTKLEEETANLIARVGTTSTTRSVEAVQAEAAARLAEMVKREKRDAALVARKLKARDAKRKAALHDRVAPFGWICGVCGKALPNSGDASGLELPSDSSR